MGKARPVSTSGKPSKKRKSAKRLLSAPESAAKKSFKPPRENPFESIWSRRKLHVIGKKRKADESRRFGVSRSLAFDKRSKTLLEDYRRSRKASSFVDRRIGEGDEALGEFDKSILRLQRERQRKLKKESKYNLSDGEEDDFEAGLAFSKVDDFDEEMPFDEDEDIELNANSRQDRFLSLQENSIENSLSDADENKHKSKKQVYEEIIAKSKLHKALKAREKEADERLLEQLDKDFSFLTHSGALISLTQPSKMNALKALLDQNNRKPNVNEGLNINPLQKEKPDAYDMLIKEMALEARARPSDRTKTPEEIAQEEKERLELLEEERKKRMLASEDSADESSEDYDDDHKLSVENIKHVSGDDFGDTLPTNEKSPGKKSWGDMIQEKRNEEGGEVSTEGSESDEDETNDGNSAEEDSGFDAADVDNEVSEEDEDDGVDGGLGGISGNFLSGKDWEQSDGDFDTDEEQMLEDINCMNRNANADNYAGAKEVDVGANKEKVGKLGVGKLEPLPFVIDAPKNMTELCSLFDNRPDAEIIEAVNRIRACNAVKLSAENRKKMQVFYGVLLQYFAVLTTKRPLNVRIINLLVRPLVEMSMDTPYFAAICARERLTRIRAQFCGDVKNPEKSSWPSLKTLMLLRLWSLIFPCTDFRHAVMTPATLLTCEYLMRCPIVHCRDTAIGSFLCSMLLLIAKQSHKFFPEAIIFLQILLLSAIDAKHGLQEVSPPKHALLDYKTAKNWLRIEGQVFHVLPLDLFVVMDLPVDSPVFVSDDFRVSVLSLVVETIGGFIEAYDDLISFPEIFLPVSSLLCEVSKQHGIPDSLRGKTNDTAMLIKRKCDEKQLLRQPLQMRKQKPVPLKLINPKFEENYEKGRDYDPDRERVERKKLKKLLKREAKGAVRELRKDNYFLLEAKEKDRLLLEEERAEKYGKARAFLQEQEHAYRSGQLGKGRKRRR